MLPPGLIPQVAFMSSYLRETMRNDALCPMLNSVQGTISIRQVMGYSPNEKQALAREQSYARVLGAYPCRVAVVRGRQAVDTAVPIFSYTTMSFS